MTVEVWIMALVPIVQIIQVTFILLLLYNVIILLMVLSVQSWLVLLLLQLIYMVSSTEYLFQVIGCFLTILISIPHPFPFPSELILKNQVLGDQCSPAFTLLFLLYVLLVTCFQVLFCKRQSIDHFFFEFFNFQDWVPLKYHGSDSEVSSKYKQRMVLQENSPLQFTMTP